MPYKHVYIILRSERSQRNIDYCYKFAISDPYEEKSIKDFDLNLHKRLSEIFHERKLTRDQIKELSRSPAHNVLSDLFPKINKLSLLWTAVLCGYQNTAELLVRSGADVNERYTDNSRISSYVTSFNEVADKSSILHALVGMYPSEWNERFIGLVLEYSTTLLKTRDCHGRTALHLAVMKGRVQITKLFLEKGAKVNVIDHDSRGNTPLLEAAKIPEAEELVPLLLEHGADVTYINKHDKNVLVHLAEALDGDHANLAKVLIEKGASLNNITNDGSHRPILIAATKGKNELVKLLLDHGENVNARSRSGEFPLYSAAGCDNPAVLLTLFKRGADIDQKTYWGETALHNACRCAKRKNVEILLSAGADMFAEDDSGKTPYARIYCEGVKNRIVQLMIKTLVLRKARLGIESETEQPFGTRIRKISEYYCDCMTYLSKTKVKSFFEDCSFFDLLTKCQCQIAMRYMGKREFEVTFKLQDLRIFSMYAEDIRGAFERAQRYYQPELEDVINEAFYYYMPDVVVRKVLRELRLLFTCEKCEINEIVQASRSGGGDFFVLRNG